MNKQWPLAIAAAVALAFVLKPGTSNAFECPQHFAAAQAAIDKTVADMAGMTMDPMMTAQIVAFLDRARADLAHAMEHHAGAEGGMDHAKSIAGADTALAYATAADIWHFRMMQAAAN
jgi:hypothetical protein